MKRRQFLKDTAIATVALSAGASLAKLTPVEPAAAMEAPKVAPLWDDDSFVVRDCAIRMYSGDGELIAHLEPSPTGWHGWVEPGATGKVETFRVVDDEGGTVVQGKVGNSPPLVFDFMPDEPLSFSFKNMVKITGGEWTFCT